MTRRIYRPHYTYRRKIKFPLATFISDSFHALTLLWFLPFYGLFLFARKVIMRQPFERLSTWQRKKYSRNFTGLSLLVFLNIITFNNAPDSFSLIALVSGLILLPIATIQTVKYFKRRAITSDIDRYLRKALMDMDSTSKWYNNEEEANRELVTCLKSQGLGFVQYQPRIGNGRAADAKVGNMLIEGKLSPETKDIDRLLGQLSEYTRHGKVTVVIYGRLHSYDRKRIESELRNRYPKRAFLSCLDNPKRLRQNHA